MRLFRLTALALLAAWPVAAQEAVEPDAALRNIQQEIERLERELRSLGRREHGVLAELERVGAELRLRRAEQRRVELRGDAIRGAIVERNGRIAELERAQAERARYLAFRLREIYMDGPAQVLRRLVGGSEVERYLAGLRYAALLSQRDAVILRDYGEERRRLDTERAELVEQQEELDRVQVELAAARRRLERTRQAQSDLLGRIRDDRETRESALEELESAAAELSRLVDSLGPAGAPALLDVTKFRGLLDWPAAGKVAAGFGSVVHPRFKTRVPHPGLDIVAEPGTDIVSVFDGRVVFAAWMRGYGLTAIVDHGDSVLSVYAHAAVLLVESGQRVLRGQRLGKIGDTGSLRGPFLYFELRVDGRPVDPTTWLRPR